MKVLHRAAAVIALAAFSASLASAAPGDKKKADKAPNCPACKMALSTKKDKAHTKAVKIGKKTYYCCSACKMK